MGELLEDKVVEAIKKETMGHIYRHDWSEGERLLEPIIQEGRATGTLYEYYGICLEEMGRRSEAIEALEEARAKNRTTPNLHFNLSVYHYNNGDNERSQRVLEEAVEKGETNPDVYFNLACLLDIAGRTEKGIEVLEKALEKRETSPEIFLSLIQWQHHLGRSTEAKRALVQAMDANQCGIEHGNAAADMFEETGEYKEGIYLLELFLQRGLSSEESFVTLGRLYRAEGEIEKAAATIERAFQRGFDGVDLYNNLGTYYDLLRQKEKSMSVYLKGLQKGRINPELIRNLGISMSEKGQRKEAQNLFEKAIVSKVESPDIYYNLSVLYAEEGNYLSAIELLLQGIKKGFESPDIYQNLAAYHHNNGDSEAARTTFEKALEKGQTNSNILGKAFLESGEEKYLQRLKAIAAEKSNNDYGAHIFLLEEARKRGDEGKTILFDLIGKMHRNKVFISRLQFEEQANNTIYTLRGKDALDKTIIIKGKKGNFQEEFTTREILKEYLQPRFKLPNVLGTYKDGENQYYIMERETGLTITELFENINELFPLLLKEGEDGIPFSEYIPEDFEGGEPKTMWKQSSGRIVQVLPIPTKELFVQLFHDITTQMARIHYQFDSRVLPSYQIAEKIEERLKVLGAGELMNEMQPLIRTLSNTSHRGLYNDSRTDNWMLANTGEIILLDTEKLVSAPVTQDLAQLLNCTPCFSLEMRLTWVKHYAGVYNLMVENMKRGEPIERERFLREYADATIFRTMGNLGYLKGKDLLQQEIAVLDSGRETLDWLLKSNLLETGEKESYRQTKVIFDELFASYNTTH